MGGRLYFQGAEQGIHPNSTSTWLVASQMKRLVMKALSVKQPWANMIASGEKTIETRKWYTDYRGLLLIVSSKTPRIEPAGNAIAIAKLIDCRPMTKKDEEEACCEWYLGAYAWVLTNIKKIEPFPVRGQLGIFDVDYIFQGDDRPSNLR
jgi:hypothetical protein